MEENSVVRNFRITAQDVIIQNQLFESDFNKEIT